MTSAFEQKKSFSWIHSVFARAPKKSNMLTYDPWGKEALMHPRRLVAQSRPHLSGLWWAIYSWYLMTVAKVHKFWIIFWENVFVSILYLNCTKMSSQRNVFAGSKAGVCGKHVSRPRDSMVRQSQVGEPEMQKCQHSLRWQGAGDTGKCREHRSKRAKGAQSIVCSLR